MKSQIVVEISKNEKKVIIYSWFENKENDQTIEAAHLEDFKQIFCTYIASKKAINQKNKNSKNPPNEDSNNPPNEDSKNQQRSLPENDVVTVYVSNINGKCVAWSVQTLSHASYTKTFNNLMSSLMDPFDRRRIQTQYVVSIDRDAEQKANSFWIKYVNRIPTDYERKKVHEQLEQHLGKDVLNNPLPIQGEVEHFELKDRSIAMLNGWNTQDETITLRL